MQTFFHEFRPYRPHDQFHLTDFTWNLILTCLCPKPVTAFDVKNSRTRISLAFPISLSFPYLCETPVALKIQQFCLCIYGAGGQQIVSYYKVLFETKIDTQIFKRSLWRKFILCLRAAPSTASIMWSACRFKNTLTSTIHCGTRALQIASYYKLLFETIIDQLTF